jgi:hypothetical protein
MSIPYFTEQLRKFKELLRFFTFEEERGVNLRY